MSAEGHPDQSMWEHIPMTGTEPKDRKLKLKEVATILSERGVEPIGAICDVLPELQPALRAKTLLALAEFIHPKLGRTVVVGDPAAPIKHEHTHQLPAETARVLAELSQG